MIDLLEYIERSKRLRPSTRRGYIAVVKSWLAFAGTDPSGWTTERAQAFYDDMLTRVSVATANSAVSAALGYVFSRAEEREDIPHVFRHIEMARVQVDPDDAKLNALSADQAQRLLKACDGPKLGDARDLAILRIGLFTGMRRGSLCTLMQDNVLDEGEFVVLKPEMKGGFFYRMPLDKRAWSLTNTYRQTIGTRYMFPRIRIPSAGTKNQIVIEDKPITPDGLYKALAKRAVAAGVDEFHPHSLRHTFVTWCRMAGVPDYIIGVVTGHKGDKNLVNRVYTDKRLLYQDAAKQCFSAVATQLQLT